MEAFMSLEKASEAAHFHPAKSKNLVAVLVRVAAETTPGSIPPFKCVWMQSEEM